MSRHSPKEIERIKRIAASADFGKPIAQGSLAAPAGSASEAIVYAGKHYGRKHRILFDTGNLVTLIHEPSGDTLTVHGCDVERETPNVLPEPSRQ